MQRVGHATHLHRGWRSVVSKQVSKRRAKYQNYLFKRETFVRLETFYVVFGYQRSFQYKWISLRMESQSIRCQPACSQEQ